MSQASCWLEDVYRLVACSFGYTWPGKVFLGVIMVDVDISQGGISGERVIVWAMRCFGLKNLGVCQWCFSTCM